MAKSKKVQEILEENATLQTEDETPHPPQAVPLPLEGKASGDRAEEEKASSTADAVPVSFAETEKNTVGVGETSETAVLLEETEESEKKEGYVDYCLPFLPGKDMGDFQTVTLNGKNYQVAYGVPVKVPLGVKEILEDMVTSTRLLKNKIDRLSGEERCIAKFD